MNLYDILKNNQAPQAWLEGQTIPWNEPAFSQRMLAEHLTQNHNAASRRFVIIEQHVTWIHEQILDKKIGRILDLACGPGLYVQRFSALGHECLGIDFSPASIAYAREQNPELNFVESDIRLAEYGKGYDLAMFIFGEFNVFPIEDVRQILKKIHTALKDDGILLIEPHHYEAIKNIGQKPKSWYASPSGLFSDKAHFVLMENFWLEAEAASVTRHYVIDAETSEVSLISATMQAYTDEDYRQILTDCGFGDIAFYPCLTGSDISKDTSLFVISAKKDS